jgi:hypothetical protein
LRLEGDRKGTGMPTSENSAALTRGKHEAESRTEPDNGKVCKTFIRRFDSDPRLQHQFPRLRSRVVMPLTGLKPEQRFWVKTLPVRRG